MLKRIANIIQSSYVNEEHRRLVMFNLLNILLAGVSLAMTVVNANTGELELMAVTALFSLLCIINYAFVKFKITRPSIQITAFTVEAMVLLVYFALSGNPDGFSVLWTLLVPSVSLYVFGQKKGVYFSVLIFIMISFFFWIPFGRGLLYYEYSETFMLRFPFVYICMFIAALYIDIIRLGVYRKLKETEKNARHLYRHDALTGIYTRYAFVEELDKIFDEPFEEKVSVAVFDIDNFKNVNDRYGHDAGDKVLKTIAEIIVKNTCEHCVSCRWGGEEFLVLMQCDHDPFENSENIRRIIENTGITVGDLDISITVSVGVTYADRLSIDQLGDFINFADSIMYSSKTEGKNRTTIKKYERA